MAGPNARSAKKEARNMPYSISSLSRRRALGASALLATLAVAHRRKALAAGGSLNILNCNVAWSTGLEGLVVRCRRKIPSGQEPSAVAVRLPEPERGYHLSASHY
jgi:hypothetical protein